jgi:hypothetical protein
MNRTSRQRLRESEKLCSVAVKKHEDWLRQWAREAPTRARRHATLVAAITLSGKPEVDEPLGRAWARTLRHYDVSIKQPGHSTDQIAAAQQLFPIIIGRENESARFAEIFRTAPMWLLQFTATALDAGFLNFQLPPHKYLTWGSVGLEEARC